MFTFRKKNNCQVVLRGRSPNNLDTKHYPFFAMEKNNINVWRIGISSLLSFYPAFYVQPYGHRGEAGRFP